MPSSSTEPGPSTLSKQRLLVPITIGEMALMLLGAEAVFRVRQSIKNGSATWLGEIHAFDRVVDSVHFTDAGNATMADRVAAVLRESREFQSLLKRRSRADLFNRLRRQSGGLPFRMSRHGLT